jgi:ABC-type transport system substrate-binding protein
MPGHSPRVAPPYDPARTRALLAGNAAVGELVVAGLDLWGVSTREIVELLEAVGVEARALNVATDPELFAAIEAEAHAFVWAWNAETPDAGEFLSSIVRDTPMYRDERLEELLAEAASLHDRDERLRRYREYERLWIGEHAAIVPLAYSKTELWHRSWITGMWVNGFGMASFAEAVVRR